MKKICLIFFLLCSSFSYAHEEYVMESPKLLKYIDDDAIYKNPSEEEDRFEICHDCPTDKPFFKRPRGYMLYPEIIVLVDAIKPKYINLTIEQNLLKLSSNKALIICEPQDEACFKKREVIKAEVEKEIGLENEIISRQNEEIDSKRSDIRKKIKEIKEYNKNIKTERDYFQKYGRIFSNIAEDMYMRPLRLMGFAVEPIEYNYFSNHPRPPSDDYSKIRETNRDIQKKNLEIEKENQKIEKINQHRHQQNELILKTLKSYFSPEYLDGIEKEYEQMLKDRCFSCSDLPTSIMLSEVGCKLCSDRKFIPDGDRYLGTCQLIDKKEE